MLALPAFGQSSSAPQDPSATTTAPAAPSTATSVPADQPPAAPAAQQPASTPAPAAAPARPPTWSAGPIDFSGLADVYYTFNGNHPHDLGGCSAPASCGNQLYNFNVQPNQFSLNMIKLSAAHLPDPVGFQVDFGFGRAFDIISQGERDPQIFRYIEQAYASFKPAKLHGVEFDFGKFVTSDGAEVIETMNNWNYSRSLLFAWAIPYYHFGLRVNFPVGKHFTGGVMLVNGWNNVEDNNSGKTYMFTGNYTSKYVAWALNYHTGPENPNTNAGWRHLFDTTVTLTPTSKLSAYLNYDYGQNRCFLAVDDESSACAKTGGGPSVLSVWTGVAAAVRYQVAGKWAIAPRIEWFADRQGFSTGTPQHVKEGTFTVEYKLLEGLLARGEYRYDWSDVPFFNRGDALAVSKHQTTATLGVVAFFGPKR